MRERKQTIRILVNGVFDPGSVEAFEHACKMLLQIFKYDRSVFFAIKNAIEGYYIESMNNRIK